MNAASQRRLTPVLVILALLLGALWLALLAGFGRGVHWDAPRAAALPPASGKHAGLPTPLPLAEFAPVWQQSLFSPDRKPEAHAASGGSSLGDLVLTGIILTPQLHMALLHDKNGNKELRLREGQSLPDGSLSLVEVKPRSVILDSAQGRTELKLPAGAPIDAAKAVPPTAASAMAADPMGAPRGDAGTPGGGAMQQVVPMGQGASRQQPPPYTPQQLDRLRKLKAAILQRRAASQAANHEGAH
ncbi:general secretion pathway protein GspN [Rhodanobacter sp. C06]|uniref:general secretion pathway protein GspN n=1 Tax=Rhodanobacter sp. C06 TaxID=1945854 RepID=UPI0009863B7F|nr:general secretion pathway protein GspN [Rhodanobacter sp. C06]OOG44246.1 general secretion pathway protein GspN [Rhodanobacter sp. C06]